MAERIRIATYNADLSRQGPGLLLRDILGGKDPQPRAAAAVVAAVAPDVILLTGIDYDLDLHALTAFAGLVAEQGLIYPHAFALRPNSGRATGIELDGDGRTGGPADAQGFGAFAGAGGMAILSRFPLGPATDYSGLLWRDLPGALIGDAGLAADAAAIQRLSSTGHWSVPVLLPGGRNLALLGWHGSPPVFDGPDDRNGRRNHDETAFWLRLMDGALPFDPPEPPFVILGDANLDPVDGDGRPEALRTLLADPRLQDPRNASDGGAEAAAQGGANSLQKGDPALDTADWPDAAAGADAGPGNMRVDYVLPSAAIPVIAAGVWWPRAGSPEGKIAAMASRHRLVWVDLDL